MLPADLYANPLYIAAILVFFSSAVFVSAYLATRTTRRLRAREGEMIQLGSGSAARLRPVGGALSERPSRQFDAGATGGTRPPDAQHHRGHGRVEGCTIRLLHETSTQLCLASTYGLSEEYLQKGCLLVEQNPLVRQVLAGEVVSVPDITADSRLQYPAEAAAEGIRSTLTAPLVGKSGPIGHHPGLLR